MIEGIVAFTTAEAVYYRRQDLSRPVFQFGSPTTGHRADTILVPKIPRELLAPNVYRASLIAWLTGVLPTKLRPGGRIEYADVEDQRRVLLGQ